MTRVGSIRRGVGLVVLLAQALAVCIVTTSAAAPPPPSRSDGPAPSAGCGTSTADPVVEEQQFIDVGGSSRWFLKTVPGAHDGSTPLPLVIDFHGLGEGAQIHTLMSEFSPIAEREGFVVAFPHGRFDPVRWDADPRSEPNEDLAFVEKIIDTLGQELCLDRRRVYAAGMSYGAFMTSLVTCKLSSRFAAVAPVAGVFLTGPCEQDRPVPILAFHGTDDAIVKFNGGFGPIPLGSASAPATTAAPSVPTSFEPAAVDLDGPGIPSYVAGWAERNGCRPTPEDVVVTAEVLRRTYDCPQDADVEFVIVLGGGHTWPGSEFSRAIASIVGYTTFDIDASEAAWSFFEQFQLPCPDDSICDNEAEVPAPTAPPAAPRQIADAAVQPSFTG